MTKRQEQALKFFVEDGYNCAQSVLMAYADLLGMTKEQAAMLASGFGGGIGRMRGNCGAYSAAVMVCGALTPGSDTADARADVYQNVRGLHAGFMERCGTVSCAELLNRFEKEPPQPEARTEAYYASRPCARLIAQACELIEEQI